MTKFRFVFTVLLAVLTTAPLALPARAMTVLAVDLPQLVQTSELVLHGKIVSVKTRDQHAQGRGVWTEFTLDVTEAWKGEEVLKVTQARGTKQFTWAHPGGLRSDGMMVSVPGMPAFQVGEEVVVALEKTAQGYTVCGGPQGKWNVQTDKLGKKTIVRDMPDVHFLAQNRQTGAVTPVAAPQQGAKLLADFKADVLAAQKAAPQPAVAPIPVHRVK